MTLNGISLGEIVLANVSAIDKNKDPNRAEIGKTFLLLLPINNLTIFGIVKPTHEIMPHIATEVVVRIVAITIYIIKNKS